MFCENSHFHLIGLSLNWGLELNWRDFHIRTEPNKKVKQFYSWIYSGSTHVRANFFLLNYVNRALQSQFSPLHRISPCPLIPGWPCIVSLWQTYDVDRAWAWEPLAPFPPGPPSDLQSLPGRSGTANTLYPHSAGDTVKIIALNTNVK